MKHKELDELYHENTSSFTKSYNVLFKVDLILFPILLIGMFLDNEEVQLYSTLLFILLSILLFSLFIFDTYFRIKKGKQREEDEKRI